MKKTAKIIDLKKLKYKKLAKNEFNAKSIYVTLYQQKCIMLPRVSTLKKVVFTKRIVAYKESFVPVGGNNFFFPFVCLWHEGI